jgi:hypothetical protein
VVFLVVLILLLWCSFSSNGEKKAQSAVDDARARHTSMLKEMQLEDEVVKGLPEWTHPRPHSRPTSGTEKADKVLQHSHTLQKDAKSANLMQDRRLLEK